MRVDKRVVIILAVIAVVSVRFWTGSRYPSLHEKAVMGGSAQLEDPLSFEALIPLQPHHSARERVVYTTLNWLKTNRRGMTFGLMLGAGLLTLIGILPQRGYQSGFANTLLGVATGVPLGVCVNCSAPVAQGMHDGGARLETTLATMFSSPTLNVVVLTMVFSMFPPYLSITKVALTLLFVVGMIPLLTRTVFRKERLKTYDDSVCPGPPPHRGPPSETWLAALWGTAVALTRNLWYIVKRTVPLMLLAGLLGALVATFLPLDRIVSGEPSLGVLFAVAGIGIFLPVPVAFDVVVAAVLLSAGAPVIYVMVLLFTLGIFSVYPFSIVWRSISGRVAVTLAGVLVVLGLAGGLIAQHFHDREVPALLELLDDELHGDGGT